MGNFEIASHNIPTWFSTNRWGQYMYSNANKHANRTNNLSKAFTKGCINVKEDQSDDEQAQMIEIVVVYF